MHFLDVQIGSCPPVFDFRISRFCAVIIMPKRVNKLIKKIQEKIKQQTKRIK